MYFQIYKQCLRSNKIIFLIQKAINHIEKIKLQNNIKYKIFLS